MMKVKDYFLDKKKQCSADTFWIMFNYISVICALQMELHGENYKVLICKHVGHVFLGSGFQLVLLHDQLTSSDDPNCYSKIV